MRKTEDQLILVILLTLLKFISIKRKVLDRLHQHKCSSFPRNELSISKPFTDSHRVSTFALLPSHQEETFQKCPKRWQAPCLFFYYQKILGLLGIHYMTKVIQASTTRRCQSLSRVAYRFSLPREEESCFTGCFSEDTVLNLQDRK